MNSWDVLREACDKVGVKMVAARLNLSTALVYKWCQEPRSDEDPDASGARNPLDRVRALYQVTEDARVVNWLCHHAGGFFVQNPVADTEDREGQLLNTTQRVVQDFSQMLTDISQGIEDDGYISPAEAEQIRQSWEALKTQAEQFVVACERGTFGPPTA